MNTDPSVQTTQPTVRDAVPLRQIRLVKCAVQHGDDFKIYKEPYDKRSPFDHVTQAYMVGVLNDPRWRIVYYMDFVEERPFRKGWHCYVIEIEDITQPGRSKRYAFSAPSYGVLDAILKAKRAQDRLAKTKAK